MRKNDAGLTILERFDVVRIGTGKVEYTVLSDVVTHEAHIESKNTGRAQTVDASRLVLVQSVRETEEWQAANAVAEEPETLDNMTWALSDHDTEPVKETSAYAKAVLFALNKLQKHVYAGTVRDNVKAKRRGLNRRQKTSRRANR